MTAKLEKSQDEMGRMLYAPSMPGNKTGQALPYFFDLMLALRVERDAEGVTQRALMCDGDGLWQAKDRSGKLDQWEGPDLGEIIKEIAAEEGLAEHLSSLFRWKPEVNLSAWKSADKVITAPFLDGITTTPGRASFSVTKD